ncbi:hepcidin [Protopterus annectens]|uniref:hepcidin n=1 Tax=Protopterus annectens TaxID=7888 RepID=UPI001CFBE978|nr:hepcidin [Protopterus annectens]
MKVCIAFSVAVLLFCFHRTSSISLAKAVDSQQVLSWTDLQNDHSDVSSNSLVTLLLREKRDSHFPICTYCCNCCKNKKCGFCCRT